MALELLNEYRAITSEEVEQVICAASLSEAAAALEIGTVKLDQVSIMRKNVSVQVPDLDVRFAVKVAPEAAITAGCVALPNTYVVKAGEKVILQAVPGATSGYTFTGWFRGLVSLSTEEVAEIAIVAPPADAVADEITAQFTLTP